MKERDAIHLLRKVADLLRTVCEFEPKNVGEILQPAVEGLENHAFEVEAILQRFNERIHAVMLMPTLMLVY